VKKSQKMTEKGKKDAENAQNMARFALSRTFSRSLVFMALVSFEKLMLVIVTSSEMRRPCSFHCCPEFKYFAL
jgi:hypothetical protein